MSSPSPSARLAGRYPFPVVLGAVALALCYAAVAQTHYPGGSDAPYHILTARAWFGGHGFNPADPTQTKYPPGWPLVLGAVGTVIGGTYSHFARFTAALFPLVLAATWLFVRRRSGSALAAGITAAVAFSPACFIAATRGVRTEVLFTAAALGFLAWGERAFAERRISVVRVLTGTILLVGAILLRTIGIALLLATAATIAHLLVFDRPRARRVGARAAIPACAAALALATWQRMHGAAPAERYVGEKMNLYDNQFLLIDPHRPTLGVASIIDILARVPGNLRMIAAHASEMLTNLDWISPVWTSPLLVAVFVLLVVGMVRELRRAVPLPAYYLLAYVGILSVWPFDEGQRFLVPIFPLLTLLAFSGSRDVVRFFRVHGSLTGRMVAAVSALEVGALLQQWFSEPAEFGRQSSAAIACWFVALAVSAYYSRSPGDPAHSVKPRPVGIVCLSFVAAIGIVQIGAAVRSNWRSDRESSGFDLASDWIRRNTDSSAVVMAQFQPDFELTTGRRGAVFPVTSNRAVLLRAVRGTGARYLVVYDAIPEDAYYFPLETDRLAMINTASRNRVVLRLRHNEVSVYELPSP